ncbi:MAG: DNA repair protein RecN, partial [Pseudomonadota bacterium]
SGDTLRDLSGHLVELHGQHGDRGLLNPRGHRLLLDAFAGADTALVRAAWDQVRRSTADLKQAEASLAEAAKDAEYLRHAVAEMEDLAPELGEADALDTRRRAMRTGAQVAEDVARAAAALGPEGAEGLLFDATRWLEGSADGVDGALEGGLDPALDALARAVTELGEAQGAVETCLAALAFDPAELERVEDRLFAVRALARKHSCGPDDLPFLGRDLRARLDLIDTGDAHLADLRAAQSQVQADYDAAAAKLSDQRAEAAARLDTAMGAELAPLKLERAIFATDLTRGEPGPEGTDSVAFTVATTPGAPAGPIDKISSGGELSRFLLALKVCLTRRAEGVTLIFDEIDRGVGGATADAIGRRLATLAENAQILVVTHSPQVAAQGGHQWRVSKSVEAGETLSRVAKLDADARRREIARMLAGDVITPEAEAAAAALLTR